MLCFGPRVAHDVVAIRGSFAKPKAINAIGVKEPSNTSTALHVDSLSKREAINQVKIMAESTEDPNL